MVFKGAFFKVLFFLFSEVQVGLKLSRWRSLPGPGCGLRKAVLFAGESKQVPFKGETPFGSPFIHPFWKFWGENCRVGLVSKGNQKEPTLGFS